MEHPREKLHIPANVKTHTELFPGYGMAEVGKTVVTALVVSGLAFLVYLFNHSTTFIIVALIMSVAFGVTVHRKDDNNISVAAQVGFMLSFVRAQKKLPYRAEREW